jgi:hypothetical protein
MLRGYFERERAAFEQEIVELIAGDGHGVVLRFRCL